MASSPTPSAVLTITSVTPSKVVVGSAATTLTIAGAGFVSTTVVSVGGVAEATTFMSSSQLTAIVPANQLATGAELTVTAANGSTVTAPVNLEVDNPSPVLTAISPAAISAGASDTTVTLTGTGFITSSVAQINASKRPTTYTSSTQLTVALTAADLATAGTAAMAVLNPLPGGGASAEVKLTINPAASTVAPTVTSVTPAKIPAGSPATTVTIAGAGFVSTSVANVGGVVEATMFGSSSQLTMVVPASQLAAGAELGVTVANGSTVSSPALNLEVDNPIPVLSGISPGSVSVGSPATTMTLTGTGFVTSSVVQFNGSSLSTNYASATQLTATLSAGDLATAGNAAITVSNPMPGGGASGAETLIISGATPTLQGITPNAAPIGSPVDLAVTGAGFTGSTVVQWNGTALVTTYQDSADLSAQVPAALLNLPGNYQVTVADTGSAGGAAQTPFTFTGYVGILTNSMVYNPSNGLFYVSIPSGAGSPYGNSVVSVDPASGALGTPIAVGSEPDKLAISSDGTTLWVGLDGASVIEQVNLQTGVVGMQIPLADNTGVYDFPPIVHSLAVLPGTPNSVAASVDTNDGLYEDKLIIYDSGVARANTAYLSAIESLPAIVASPTKAEIYATSFESGYNVFSYDSSGLTLIATNSNGFTFSAPFGNDLQIDNGRAYLDSGQILDAEATTLLGTIYSSANVPATGPMFSESASGRDFVLLLGNAAAVSSSGIYSAQIESFSESTLTPVSSSLIPVNGLQVGTKYGAGSSTETELDGNNNPDTLTRWGSDGLAFRAPNGIFSVRSNLVHDLSAVDADLGVILVAGSSVATGTTATFTATISNGGPSTATGVVLTGVIPANTVLVSASGSQGTCVQSSPVKCSLGSLASGAQANVSLMVQATTPGQASASVQVSASETDPNNGNNTANAAVTITGSELNPAPALIAVTPNSVQAGSADLTITLSGTGFNSASTVLWDGAPLSTSFVSPTQLTAEVPANSMSALNWAAVSVSTPAPGGGITSAIPFFIYNVVAVAANHILYDPYTRLLYASTQSSATQVAGNSLVTINPATGSLGTAVSIGSQPDNMALSDDGQVLYVNEDGSSSVGYFNMLTQTLGFSFTIPNSENVFAISLRDVAVLPGSENTIAVDLGEDEGSQLFDVNTAQQTATARGNPTGTYTGTSLQFLNPSTLFTDDTDTSGATLNSFAISGTGLAGSYANEYELNNFSAFKIRGGLAFANSGGVADPSVVPARQLGVYLPVLPVTSSSSYYLTYDQLVEPDPALGQVFFATQLPPPTGQQPLTPIPGLIAYDETTFLPNETVPLAALNTLSDNQELSYTDLVRWGQDGLALLDSSGQVIILRGPFVVPQLLNRNAPATLSSTSPSSAIHGPSNLLLTLSGSGFIPGAAANWNGAYRTTTFVDSGHLTVAIPASDLAGAGSVTVTVVNPGASASAPLTFPIN